jgi:hypothetical protein
MRSVHIGVSQKSLDPLQSVVDNETFQQLMTVEQGVAEVFKKHTEVRQVQYTSFHHSRRG